MRPSFWRVRSWVSSIDRPSESTLLLTSPTFVLTNFFVAHAVDPPIVTWLALGVLFVSPGASSAMSCGLRPTGNASTSALV